MAQNPKVKVDVEIGDIDKQSLKQLTKDIAEGLRHEKIDPKWEQTYRQINQLKKDSLDIEKKNRDVQREIEKIDDKNTSNKKLRESLDKKTSDAQINSMKSQHALIRKSQKLEDKLNQLRKRGKEDSAEGQRIKEDLGLVEEQIRATAEAYGKKTQEINDAIIKSNKEQERIDIDRNELLSRRTEYNVQNKNIHDQLVEKQQEMHSIEGSRIELQKKLTEYLIAQGKSQSEAADMAKEMLPITAKQSKFEDKSFKLFKKTRQWRKEEFKRQKSEFKMQKNVLKMQGVGFLERGKIYRQEVGQAKKQLGLGGKKKTTDPKQMAAAAIGGVGKQVGSLVTSLAGPLMALGSIAGFVMLMLNYNKQIMAARKNLFKFAGASHGVWKGVQKDQMTGVGQMESYRSTLRGLWDQVGIKYEDAVQKVGALTNAGIALDKVMANNAQTMVEVEQMSLLSGKSFEEMSSITGEWVTEFGVQTNKLFDTFVGLRSQAAKTEMTTSRFFSSVMNAAQGVMLYGDNIEEVGSLFADLTKNIKLPQKQAAEMASSMINNVKTMNTQQKNLVTATGGVKGMLQAELNDLNKRGKLEGKQLKRQQELNKLLEDNRLDPLEAGVRYFEALDPGKRIEAQVKALAESTPNMFEGVDITNPKALLEVLQKHRTKLEQIAPQFGMTPDQLKFLEKMSEAGTSIGGIGKAIAAEDKKKEAAAGKKQADIIAQGTKGIMDSIGQKLGHFIEKIYLFLEGPMYDFFNAVLAWLGKNEKDKQQINKSLDKDIATYESKLKTIQEKKSKVAAGSEEYKALEKQEVGAKNQLTTAKRAKQTLNSGIPGGNPLANAVSAVIPPAGAQYWKNKQAKEGMGQARMTGASTEIGELTDANRRQFGLNAINLLQNNKDFLTKVAEKDQTGMNDYIAKLISGSLAGAGADKLYKGVNISQDQEAIPIIKDILQRHAQAAATSGNFFKFGGYTGVGSANDVAGLVHKGEFVFDKLSTMKAGPANLAKLMNAIKMPKPMTIGALGSGAGSTAGGSSVVNNNNVVLNINQKDRQEIEQIVYKVLYSEKGVNV